MGEREARKQGKSADVEPAHAPAAEGHDHASGQATGKRMHKPMAAGHEYGASAGPTASQQAYGEVGEGGDMQQMQLQMATEKKTQEEGMVSNVMKGQSDTQEAIAGNLK